MTPVSQAVLAAVFVFNYIADSTLLVALVGTVATFCASVSFGLEYRRRQSGESAWGLGP